MSDVAFHETLWKLAESWPCDYVSIERPAVEDPPEKPSPISITKYRQVRPPTTISIHQDNCRKCALQKHLLRVDEQLKRITDKGYEEFSAMFAAAGAMNEDEFHAIQDHAATVREQMIGAPQ